MKYKIGQEIETKYVLPRTGARYIAGQLVDIFDDKTKQRLATFEVLEEDGVTIKGKIINTYGHKRAK